MKFIRKNGRVIPLREKAENLAKVSVSSAAIGATAHYAQGKLRKAAFLTLAGISPLEHARFDKFVSSVKSADPSKIRKFAKGGSDVSARISKAVTMAKLSRLSGGIKLGALSVASAAASGAALGWMFSANRKK